MAKAAATGGSFPALRDEQADASSPGSTDVWLSASAGTGKTQVLTARVLRLLLHGVRPESILCLTYTKAGAAEMADRINHRLARWVRIKGAQLATDLKNLGEDFGDAAKAHARTLFARVLDAPGGGLRIQTIHSFCQTLLASFPAEAGLPAGFRPIEGREEALLAETTLADMVAAAERNGELGFIERVQALSHRLGDQEARAYLRRCTGAREALSGIAPGIEARVRRALGLPADDPELLLKERCADGGFDRGAIDQLRALNAAWGTQRAQEKVDAIDQWLSLSPEDRFRKIELLTGVWTKGDGDLRSLGKGQAPQDEDYPALVEALYLHFNGALEAIRLSRTADHLANALIVGQRYAEAYADAKRRAGVVDFNDLITHTVRLLSNPEIGAWIAYKLDQRTDHILVDEAQDTNAAQWEIVRAIADEFYAGAGAKGERLLRTLFTVGDYKQAIFGFQGTDPGQFRKAQIYFTQRAREAEREPMDLSLAQSFRSSQPILDLVNTVIETITPEAFGLDRAPEQHRSGTTGQAGAVTLWPLIFPAPGEEQDESDGGPQDEEEGWIRSSDLMLARDIAEKVSGWVNGGLTLHNRGRAVQPGDVLILVRSRKDLARLIVSRLVQAKVKVAGVDRLRLDAPIAVMDLMACVRFVLQPEDDLNLASLLVSPLIGWSQDDLYEHGKGRKKGSLWRHLGEAKPQALLDLLGQADRATPHRFIEHILSGPMQGRRRLLARLGEEARDPIEELVNAALAFEREGVPTLQRFIEWFDGGENEIKRDPGEAGDAVRVMTVHGAKGLQAPIVILADATANPDSKTARGLDWDIEPDLTVPVFRPRKEERVLSLHESAEKATAREREEHWRLLYVGLTRAEEYLFIGGALNRTQAKTGVPGENSWYSRVEAAMKQLGASEEEAGLLYARGLDGRRAAKKEAAPPTPLALPDWVDRMAPEEARPPRPLAPSAIRPADDIIDPPPSPAMRAAADRGIRLHALFERLPAIPAAERRAVADRWLAGSAGVTDAGERSRLIGTALEVIEHPAFAELFSEEALAEAPLAGVVGDRVIAGTVDRLLVSDDRVLVVDFKTGRRVPEEPEAIPGHHLAQMAAYAAVLEGIFPGRSVEAALLYSQGPRLHRLPPDLLARYDPRRSQ